MTPEMPKINQAEQNWLLTFLHGAEDLMQRHNTPGYSSKHLTDSKLSNGEPTILSTVQRPASLSGPAGLAHICGSRRTDPRGQPNRSPHLYHRCTRYFQDSPDKTDRFLAQLCTMVKQHHLYQDPACETLLWLLLEEGMIPIYGTPNVVGLQASCSDVTSNSDPTFNSNLTRSS